jgi:DNA-directed RNA polymerase specialized sigma24 family protein
VSDPQTRPVGDDPIDPTVAAIIPNKAYRMIGLAGLRPQDRADIEQELAFEVLAHRDRFDPARGTWPAFARRLVERFGNNLVRFRRAAKRDGGPHAPLPDEVLSPGGGDTGGRALDVAEALAALPPRLRAVAELLMTQNVTDAAEALGVSRSTVYARLRELRGRTEFAVLEEYL